MSRRWSCDYQQNLNGVFEAYLRSIIAHYESSLEDVYIRSSRFFPNDILPNLVEDPKYDIYNGEIKLSILPAMLEGGLGFEVVPNIFLHYSQPWAVEDLGASSVWYIDILAYTDRNFFKTLQSFLKGDRSVSKTSNASITEEMLHSVFGIDMIVSQVVSAPVKERNRFIRTIIEKGTISMLKPFIDADINPDEGDMTFNYLCLAAELAKLDFFDMIVDAGANCARAIPNLCRRSYKLEKSVFKSFFSVMLDRAIADAGNKFDPFDALWSVLRSDRAMDVRPDGPAILLKKHIFNCGKVFGSEEMFIHFNYAVSAIGNNRPAALKLLLEHGTPSDLIIGEMGPANMWWQKYLRHYTLLTLAVEFGNIACVDVLLKYAKNPANSIIRLDGGGQSALQIAMAAVVASHPRRTAFEQLSPVGGKATEASALQDTAVLALLQDVLSIEHRNGLSSDAEIRTIQFENHISYNHSCFSMAIIAKYALSPIVTLCGHGFDLIYVQIAAAVF
ncbi:MAG: hypothetical protein Q9167_006890 [Letrouitia subvulpina]